MARPASHLAFFVKRLSGGGAERTLLTLAASVQDRGHRVDLVLARAEGPLLSDVPPGVRVVDLRAKRAIRALPSLLRLPGISARLLGSAITRNRPRVLAALPVLARYLRQERPDALLATVEFNPLVALWAHTLSGVETRIIIREANPPTPQIGISGKPELRLLADLMTRFYPEADAIVSISKGIGDDLAAFASLPRDRIVTIYNPVDLDRVERLAAEPLEHPWFAPGAPPVLVCAARLNPQKDHPTLLRAFARARRHRPLRLLVLGEGRERVRLENLVRELGIAEDVRLPGFQSNPHPFVARAGAFVLASAYEGFGNVLVDALACGTPVVATDCPSGPGEILEHGAWGRLVPVGDDEALADAILATLDAPPDPAILRQRARDFSPEHATERYLELLLD